MTADLDEALAAVPPATESAVSTVLAIDPGPVRSAWVELVGGVLDSFGIEENGQLVDRFRCHADMDPIGEAGTIVIEKVESFGMAVGAEVFETVFWSGRFAEAAHPATVHRIGRKAVKLHLCRSVRAKDANIRQALIDRYGGPAATRKGGALHGVSKDVWSALAVAVTFLDGIPVTDEERTA